MNQKNLKKNTDILHQQIAINTGYVDIDKPAHTHLKGDTYTGMLSLSAQPKINEVQREVITEFLPLKKRFFSLSIYLEFEDILQN